MQTFTVYLGSSGHARPIFAQGARDLGRLIGHKKFNLVYGGMDAGLMGTLALEALQAGAQVTGIIPQKLKDSERILPGLSETILVNDLWDRKKRMFLRADTIITLPGGFGTLDETLEVLHWGALRLHSKHLILVNIENYWDPVIAYLRTLPDFDARVLSVVEKVEDVFSQTVTPHPNPLPLGEGINLPHFEDEITRATQEPIIIDQATVSNTYYALCALGLKQLARHTRPIGFVNTEGQFDDLLKWFEVAAREHFITPKCLELFDVAPDRESLMQKLAQQKTPMINLHTEKWGERRKTERKE